jgi:hypothetical protein
LSLAVVEQLMAEQAVVVVVLVVMLKELHQYRVAQLIQLQ